MVYLAYDKLAQDLLNTSQESSNKTDDRNSRKVIELTKTYNKTELISALSKIKGTTSLSVFFKISDFLKYKEF